MSRRKQAKPHQHVGWDQDFTSPEIMGDAYMFSATSTSLDSQAVLDHTHVCRGCCAEFTELADLEEHHRHCSPNQLVLIMKEKEESYAEMFSISSLSPGTPGEQGTINFEMEEIHNLPAEGMEESEESMDFFRHNNSLDRPSSTTSSTSNGTESIACRPTSALPTSLPQPGKPPEQGRFSWINSNVLIENLESTKVAVAQFSQQNHPDFHSSGNSKMSVSSLMEQLLGLQLQQIHQLQMIDQIRHQVLLFASKRLEISETPSSCSQDTPLSKQVSQLKTLSSHLSQQLATAAGLAQTLTSQSVSIGHFKQLTATVQLPQNNPNDEITLSSSEPLKCMGKPIPSAVSKQLSRKQSTFASSLYPQLSLLAQTKLQVLDTDSFQKSSNNPSLPQPPPSNQTAANSIPGISGIAEDRNAQTALTQQKKGMSTNMTFFEPKHSPKEAFFKHKCRFCAKVFGSDSALQIHLRSHTGERPYKCNICGNRFSTRGNLKVHFQRHKERYPHIQMNPYPVPEHLDNIPTSNGIPYGMSMPLEKTVTCWLDSKPPLTNPTTSASLLLPSALPKLLSVVKKEEQQVHITTPSSQVVCNFGAKKTDKSTDFAETGNDTINPKSKDLKAPLNLVSKMNGKAEESSHNLITAIRSIGTNPNKMDQFKAKYSYGGTHRLQTSETSKLQQLVENIDKKASDPNKCIICHRILSCQSALKMHYRTHTGERPYRCRLCGRSFSTKGNLKTHHAVHRATPPLRVQHSCPICQRKFTNAMVLQQHVRMHTGGQTTNRVLSNQSYLKSMGSKHFETLGGDDDDDDDDDMEGTTDRGVRGTSRFNFSSGRLSPLSSHPSDNMGVGSFDAHNTCYHGLLGERQGNCLTTGGLSEERSQVYDPSSLRGSETTTSNHSLSPHKNAFVHHNFSGLEDSYHAHLNSKPLNTTGISSRDLKPLNQLKDHSDMSLRERGIFKNTACDICGKTFACQSALDIHYRSHTKERPFICTACNRGFSTKGNLKQHMLTHQMRDLPAQLFEPSNTSIASSPNSSVLSMGSPISIKSEASCFLSTSYGKGRDFLGSLGTSSTSTSPDTATPLARRTPKQHYCQTCGKTFSSSSALQIHERTHTGEKPFACTVCGRAFTTKGNLKVHMGTHMWSSSPNRRGRRLSVEGPLGRRLSVEGPLGRRLSVEGPLTFMGTRSVKLPEPPQRNTGVRSGTGKSLYFWTQYSDSLSKTTTTRTNSVIQTGGMPYHSEPVGLNKLHHKDHNSSLIMLGKTTVERRSNFCFTRLIEERKEMIAN